MTRNNFCILAPDLLAMILVFIFFIVIVVLFFNDEDGGNTGIINYQNWEITNFKIGNLEI